MSTFESVNEDSLVARIQQAHKRVVYIAPAVTGKLMAALSAHHRDRRLSVTIIVDSEEDAYRVGFGDPKGLELLHAFAAEFEIPIRKQPGLRLGLLITDDVVTIWSPTPLAVEKERKPTEPNGIVLGADVASALDKVVAKPDNPTDSEPEIGQQALVSDEAKSLIKKLHDNPPVPFDLAQKTRVFSTKFQFVEAELKGAEWVERKIKLSSLLLNADLPEALQDILDTQVRPFQTGADIKIESPTVVHGQVAYNADGKLITVPITQSDIDKMWKDIRGRYLVQLKGFGWIIRQKDLPQFRKEIEAFEYVLKKWVDGFSARMSEVEDQLVANLVKSIGGRLERAPRKKDAPPIHLEREIRAGLSRMRVIKPGVRVVVKNLAWEATRDQEFTQLLCDNLPPEELEGWFEEFTAARQKPRGNYEDIFLDPSH